MSKFIFWQETVEVWKSVFEAETYEEALKLFEAQAEWQDFEPGDPQPEVFVDCDDWNSTRIV